MKRKSGVLLSLFFLVCCCGCGNANGAAEENIVASPISETQTGTTEEKEELTIVVPTYGDGVSVIIEAFEQKYPMYRVIQIPESELEEGSQTIVKEILAGGGPDLFPQGSIDYIEEGCVREWEDLSYDSDHLWDGLMETGVFDGKQYGIPYQFQISGILTAADYVDSGQTWDPEYMIQCVENSGAEKFCDGMTKFSLLYDLLSALGNKEELRNYLTEIAAFAEKYNDSTSYSTSDTIEKNLLNGKSFGTQQIYSLWDVCTAQALLPGGAVPVGYPTESGSTFLGTGELFFLNKNTRHEEAAKLFAEFLLSKEAQISLADDRLQRPQGTFEMINLTSMRRDSLEYYLSRLVEKKNKSTQNVFWEVQGIYFYCDGITPEQKEEIQGMFGQTRFLSGDRYRLRGRMMDIVRDFCDEKITLEEMATRLEGECEALWQ